LEPVEELVATVLSQNTSDTNTARSFAGLRARYPSWGAVIDAPTEEVANAIRSGGLANTKAPRIQRILMAIREQRGDFDLSFLNELPDDEAAAWLMSLPGVGPKTAACVLLFSLGKPALPVDTHVHRVALRLALVPRGTNAETTQQMLEVLIPPAERYAAHLLFIQHGRQTCHARRPACHACVVADICPSVSEFLKGD
jgi:endonuclease-3